MTELDRAAWPESADGAAKEGLPLTGLRIVDLSRVLAGPFATMVLADLGADVIKVEQPGLGDISRTWGPPFHGTDAAYYFAANRNRRSVVLDLTTEMGQRSLRQLVVGADVVVENYLITQFEALGLATIREEFPDLVWISIRGAGEGPLANLPGLDLLVQGRTGLMSVTGTKESGPTKVGAPVMDVVTGLYTAIAVLAGIYERLNTDRLGATIEVPLFECGLTVLVNQTASYLVSGVVPQPGGNDHPNVVPYGPFATSDGVLLVAPAGDSQFSALCRAIDCMYVAKDERFLTNADRIANRSELAQILDGAFAQATSGEWISRLQANGVPCAPVNRVDEALSEPQLQSGGLVIRVEHPAGPVSIVGSPYRVNGQRPGIRRSPSVLGEHTEEVLAALDAIRRSRENISKVAADVT